MTLAFEEENAINSARMFLEGLMIPSVTPRVPKEIRKRARQVLRHYPGPMRTEMIFEKARPKR